MTTASMQKAYEIYASAIKGLRKEIFVFKPRLLVGLDGALIEDSLGHYMQKIDRPYTSNMHNVVEISSKTGMCDDRKLYKVLESFDGQGWFYAIDNRVVSGSLQDMLRKKFDEWKSVSGSGLEMVTVALFDKNKKADKRVFESDLPDDVRINRYPSYGHVKRLFFNDEGSFRNEYLTTEEEFSKLEHMNEIKKLL